MDWTGKLSPRYKEELIFTPTPRIILNFEPDKRYCNKI